jgi:adenosine deaminase
MTGGRPSVDRERLRRLPKAELHCHLDGSLRPATMLALAAERSVAMPRPDAEALAAFMEVTDAKNLEDYLARFAVTLSVMQDPAAIARVAEELVLDAAADGVRLLEVRFAPFLSTQQGMTSDEVMAAWLAGMQRGERATGTVARAIVCALRHAPVSQSIAMAELAVAWKGRGVVAFDLAGGEAGNPASAHKAAFDVARRADLAITCHAGEAWGPASVREALLDCGAHRIGHGTRLIEDASLLQYVNDRRIPVEVCLTSNVQTRATPAFAAHPARTFFKRGVVLSLNTDNRLMSGVTLTEEYARAAEHLRFSVADLCVIARQSFESAFTPWEERRALLDAVLPEIDAVRDAR